MSRQLALPLSLADEARFSNFCLPETANDEDFPAAGSSREEALHLLMAMGTDKERADPRLALGLEFAIYLWGAEGSGKTHLIQACCRQYIEAGRKAMYLPLKTVVDYPPREVLANLESNDLLCIDDVQATSTCLEWQSALFDVYNRARDSACRLILTGLESPGNSDLRLADLRSRLAAATGFALPAYTDRERGEILSFRAGRLGLTLPREVCALLLARLPRETRVLIECLHHLDRQALEGQRRLTVPFVKTVLGI